MTTDRLLAPHGSQPRARWLLAWSQYGRNQRSAGPHKYDSDPVTGPLSCGFGGAPRGTRTPNRQIRSLPAIVRLVVCGPSVLLTSQNLVLPARLMSCGPPGALSSSVKNSVNDGLRGSVEHQISLSGAHHGGHSRAASLYHALRSTARLHKCSVSARAIPAVERGFRHAVGLRASFDPFPEVKPRRRRGLAGRSGRGC
jgi:hypothetical protein